MRISIEQQTGSITDGEDVGRTRFFAPTAALHVGFELLSKGPKAKPCRAMQGLVEESQEQITEGKEKEEAVADLMLIAAAQKMEH